MGLTGLAVPTPTLFDDAGDLSPDRNQEYAAGLCRASADHLFALGSLGEFPSVDDAERRPLLDAVRAGLQGSTDLWVGVGAPSTRRAERYAREAESAGASVLIATPPYYLRPTDESIVGYFRALAAASPLPLLAYNIPAKVGYPLAPDLVHRLAREGTLLGIKDTAGALESVEGFLRGAPKGFALLPGDDSLAVPAIRSGAAGAVMGLANIAPRLGVELVRAALAREWESAAGPAALVGALAGVVQVGPFPSTIKFLSAHLRSAPEGYRPPYGPLTESERNLVLGALAPLSPRLRPWV